MLKKVLLVSTWFPLSIVLLLVNVWTLGAYTHRKNLAALSVQTPVAQFDGSHIAASNGTAEVLGVSVTGGDARSLLLQSFLQENNSPLLPFSDLIVQKSDEYNIDFRLVVAIAMCESNVGKRIPSSKSYNAWGIAVFTGQQSGANFRDWPHAIDWVSKYIKEKYYDNGITDLKQIGSIWAPPSVEKGYSWTKCVESFVTSIK